MIAAVAEKKHVPLGHSDIKIDRARTREGIGKIRFLERATVHLEQAFAGTAAHAIAADADHTLHPIL